MNELAVETCYLKTWKIIPFRFRSSRWRDVSFAAICVLSLASMALSAKDQLVLDSIFNPLQLGGGAELDSWMIPVAEEKPEVSPVAAPPLSDSEQSALKLEAEAILLAEQKEYQKSIELFSEAIQLHPTRANTYNNRAQVYRLHGGLDDCK